MRLSDIVAAFSGEAGSKSILAGEVHAIWNFLTLRYLYREMTEIFKNYIEDTEFGMLVTGSIHMALDKQIQKTEEILKFYEIILPPSPPKGINTAVNSEALRDEMMYRLLLVGINTFLKPMPKHCA